MIKFNRNPKIHERYNLLSAPGDLEKEKVASKVEGETGEEYATFLRYQNFIFLAVFLKGCVV